MLRSSTVLILAAAAAAFASGPGSAARERRDVRTPAGSVVNRLPGDAAKKLFVDLPIGTVVSIN